MGLMEEAGFDEVERHPLTLGITSLYIGVNGEGGRRDPIPDPREVKGAEGMKAGT
jgi:hypothetical protein